MEQASVATKIWWADWVASLGASTMRLNDQIRCGPAGKGIRHWD